MLILDSSGFLHSVNMGLVVHRCKSVCFRIVNIASFWMFSFPVSLSEANWILLDANYMDDCMHNWDLTSLITAHLPYCLYALFFRASCVLFIQLNVDLYLAHCSLIIMYMVPTERKCFGWSSSSCIYPIYSMQTAQPRLFIELYFK